MESRKVSVRIIEQPTRKYRFRYEKERESVSKLIGRNGSNSVPSIEISGCSGQALIYISCVTQHKPYRPHPYSVVDQIKIKKADYVNEGFYCQLKTLSNDREVVDFKNIGIVCTKKNKIEKMLKYRMAHNIDPFKTGFNDFRSELKSEGKASPAVRLCFQVFIMEGKKVRLVLKPVVSDVIKDNKTLIIHHVSHNSGPAYRPTLITIVCNMVPKNDFEVIFFEENNSEVQWKKTAQVSCVIKENSIVCYTPLYKDSFASGQVFIKLKRKSDDMCSNFAKFIYTNSKTASKTLSKSLSPRLEQRYSTSQPIAVDVVKWPRRLNAARTVCPTCHQASLSPVFLNQDKDQVYNQVQNPQMIQVKLPKFLEWSNGVSPTSSMPDYIDSKPSTSTSRTVNSPPDNSHSEVPCLGGVTYNRQAAPERNTYLNMLAKTTPWSLKTSESVKNVLIYNESDLMQIRRWHQPTPPEVPLPSFESLKQTSPWSHSSQLEEQRYPEKQQSFGRDCVLPDSSNPSHSLTHDISPNKDPALGSTFCVVRPPNISPPVKVEDSSNSNVFKRENDAGDVMAEFENILPDTFRGSLYDISMYDYFTNEMDFSSI